MLFNHIIHIKLHTMKAKTFFQRSKWLLVIAGTAIIGITGCNKNDDNNSMPGNNQTITQVVSSDQNFSILASAVVKANLATTLSSMGPFTVFAPDNTAFTNAGITADVINSLSADQLKAILLYHTVAQKILSTDIPMATNTAVATAEGDLLPKTARVYL